MGNRRESVESRFDLAIPSDSVVKDSKDHRRHIDIYVIESTVNEFLDLNNSEKKTDNRYISFPILLI